MTLSTVTLVDLPALPVAVVRRRVSTSELSRVVPECCGLAWEVLRAQHAKAGRNVAIYWDAGIRLEAGVELAGEFSERGEVVRSATPGGTAATVTHLGPYGGLGSAHAAIQDWCKARGLRVAGPQWEIYGHWQEAWNKDASQIRTDVFYLVTSA